MSKEKALSWKDAKERVCSVLELLKAVPVGRCETLSLPRSCTRRNQHRCVRGGTTVTSVRVEQTANRRVSASSSDGVVRHSESGWIRRSKLERRRSADRFWTGPWLSRVWRTTEPSRAERLERVARHVAEGSDAACCVALEVAVLGTAAADLVDRERRVTAIGWCLQGMSVGLTSSPLLSVRWIHCLRSKCDLVILSTAACALQVSALTDRAGAVQVSSAEAESTIAASLRRAWLVGGCDGVSRPFRHGRVPCVDVERG